jgi:hypothetical protein
LQTNYVDPCWVRIRMRSITFLFLKLIRTASILTFHFLYLLFSLHILLTENLNNLAPHELITLLLLIYFRRETTLEEISGLLDLEELQVGGYLI